MNKLNHLLVMILLAALPEIAFAYIDPGTGSILIQGIIAAVAAIGVTLKLYWHRFVAFFRRSKESQEVGAAEVDDETQP